MGKELIWSEVFEGGFEEKRRAQGFETMSEQIKKARIREAEQQQNEALLKAEEPRLKAILLQHCVNKEPIKVFNTFVNPTETLGGVQKSLGVEEEDDGFYYKGPTAENPSFSAKFEEVMESIPAGTELIFKSYDKQLDKMVFKAQSGQEVEIYTKPLVFFQGKQIKNPGYYGLLYNTSIRS